MREDLFHPDEWVDEEEDLVDIIQQIRTTLRGGKTAPPLRSKT